MKLIFNCWKAAIELVARYGTEAGAHVHEMGSGKVEMIIMIFVAIVIIYQLVGQLGVQNAAIQASGNVSAMGKFAAGLGEWLFPLIGIIAVVFLLLRSRKGKGGDV